MPPGLKAVMNYFGRIPVYAIISTTVFRPDLLGLKKIYNEKNLRSQKHI